MTKWVIKEGGIFYHLFDFMVEVYLSITAYDAHTTTKLFRAEM